MNKRAERNALLVKKLAQEVGFDFCGISRAEFLEAEARQLDAWLNRNYHGKMAYMANHFDKRLDPRLLVEGARSVITVILNYYPQEELSASAYKISKYAYGKDYHYVIKEKLRELMLKIQANLGEVGGRAFVDSAPVMDKAWAKKSGAGWMGKNSNIINRSIGSFFFIAELIVDLDLAPDGPIKDYCGTCTACMDACPTDAIVNPYEVDGSRCISYLTIELKEQLPTEFKGKMENWIFGCDICQDICPWNSFAQPHQVPEFLPSEGLKNLKEWEEVTLEVFKVLFKDSPLKRTKFEGLQRNLRFVQEN